MVKFFRISSFTLPLLFSVVFETIADPCIEITSPVSGTIINNPSCTLKLENKCKDIPKVVFQARYYLPNSDSAVVKTIGQINAPQHEYVWDISNISNQLFSGVSILALAFHKNGQVDEVGKEGVFFTHNKVGFQNFTCPYDYSGIKSLKQQGRIQFQPEGNTPSFSASVYWNEQDVTFLIKVKDASFFGGIDKNILAQTGVEIMIDKYSSRKPYPDENVLIYAVPLYGKPYQITYNPEFNQGDFKLSSSTSAVNFPFSISKEDFKGYSVFFPISRAQLGSSLPGKIAFNILVKSVDPKNNIIHSSLVNGSLNDIYSPFLWNTLEFSPKPFMKNRFLIWIISFITGIAIAFLFKMIFGLFTLKKHKPVKRQSTEAEQNHFELLKSTIENKIIVKGLTTEEISQELNFSVKKINYLLKQFTGMSFANYLMYARTEIAKERLRSSHSSEVSIAELCGFKDANEMDKYFRKFHKTTPNKFRMEQQVA